MTLFFYGPNSYALRQQLGQMVEAYRKKVGSDFGLERLDGADVLVTADLKHHPVVEEVTERGPDGIALIDAAHWATEAPWLDVLAAALVDRFGTTVDVRISRQVTDPWTLHVPSAGSPHEETSPTPP